MLDIYNYFNKLGLKMFSFYTKYVQNNKSENLYLPILFVVWKICTFVHSKSVGSRANIIGHQIIFFKFIIQIRNAEKYIFNPNCGRVEKLRVFGGTFEGPSANLWVPKPTLNARVD